jgi:hypothetical protein
MKVILKQSRNYPHLKILLWTFFLNGAICSILDEEESIFEIFQQDQNLKKINNNYLKESLDEFNDINGSKSNQGKMPISQLQIKKQNKTIKRRNLSMKHLGLLLIPLVGIVVWKLISDRNKKSLHKDTKKNKELFKKPETDIKKEKKTFIQIKNLFNYLISKNYYNYGLTLFVNSNSIVIKISYNKILFINYQILGRKINDITINEDKLIINYNGEEQILDQFQLNYSLDKNLSNILNELMKQLEESNSFESTRINEFSVNSSSNNDRQSFFKSNNFDSMFINETNKTTNVEKFISKEPIIMEDADESIDKNSSKKNIEEINHSVFKENLNEEGDQENFAQVKYFVKKDDIKNDEESIIDDAIKDDIKYDEESYGVEEEISHHLIDIIDQRKISNSFIKKSYEVDNENLKRENLFTFPDNNELMFLEYINKTHSVEYNSAVPLPTPFSQGNNSQEKNSPTHSQNIYSSPKNVENNKESNLIDDNQESSEHIVSIHSHDNIVMEPMDPSKKDSPKQDIDKILMENDDEKDKISEYNHPHFSHENINDLNGLNLVNGPSSEKLNFIFQAIEIPIKEEEKSINKKENLSLQKMEKQENESENSQIEIQEPKIKISEDHKSENDRSEDHKSENDDEIENDKLK